MNKALYVVIALALLMPLGMLAMPPAGTADANSSGILNGGFETGDLTGWTSGGSGAHVEVLEASNFAPAITPPEGDHFVLLSTGPGSANSTPGADLDGNGSADYDTATLSQTFTLSASEVPNMLSFQWSFLTSEIGEADDFFMVTVNGVDILHGSVPGAPLRTSPFADVPPLDGKSYNVTSSGLTNGSVFDDGRSAFQSFSYQIDTAGTYTLEFLVAD